MQPNDFAGERFLFFTSLEKKVFQIVFAVYALAARQCFKFYVIILELTAVQLHIIGVLGASTCAEHNAETTSEKRIVIFS